MQSIGSNRVNRGGSWNNDASNCRVANRNNWNPSNTNNNLGFRLSLAPPAQGSGRMSFIEPDCILPHGVAIGYPMGEDAVPRRGW